MLSEINQTEKERYHMISLTRGIYKTNGIYKTKEQTNKKTKTRPTNTENKLVVARGQNRGRG